MSGYARGLFSFVPISAVILSVPGPLQEAEGQDPGTCGHCHETDHPVNKGEMVHQMTGDDPKEVECSGGGGHYVHDCENGDGTTWAPGACDSHAKCGEPDFLGLWEDLSRLAVLTSRMTGPHSSPVAEDLGLRWMADAVRSWNSECGDPSLPSWAGGRAVQAPASPPEVEAFPKSATGSGNLRW